MSKDRLFKNKNEYGMQAVASLHFIALKIGE